jgi:hypothetical protein
LLKALLSLNELNSLSTSAYQRIECFRGSPKKNSKEQDMNNYGNSLLDDLLPEELDPRLELQLLVDPLALLSTSASNTCCRDGGNCAINISIDCDNTCRDGGTCNIMASLAPMTRRLA